MKVVMTMIFSLRSLPWYKYQVFGERKSPSKRKKLQLIRGKNSVMPDLLASKLFY
jgi:hypothetical protein